MRWTSMMLEVSEGVYGWVVEDMGDDGIEIRYWEREGDREDGNKVVKATISCQDESGEDLADALKKVIRHRKAAEKEKDS